MVNPVRCAYETDLVVGRREDEFAISTTMVVFILGLPRIGHPARLIHGKLSWRSFSASFFFFSREASKQAARGLFFHFTMGHGHGL